jgi:hypothetical protein
MSEANELRTPAKPAIESEHKGVTDILGDAVHSALYSAVQEPISGVTQMVDEFAGQYIGTKLLPKVQFMDAPVQAKFGSVDWHAQQVGSAVGMLVPFLLVGKGVKGVLGTSAMTAEEASLMSRKAVFGMSMKEAGLTGFTYDAAFRPSDSKNEGVGQFLMDRGKQGLIGAGTFMTLTGTSLGLSRFAGSAAVEKSALVPLLKNPIASGIISGVPAGLFTAEANSLNKTGHLASGTEVGQSVYGMSLMGAGFGAVHALNTPGESGGPSKVDAFTAKIKSTLSSARGPREGLSLLGGDKIGPEGGAEHSVSDSKTDPVVDQADQVVPEKVVAETVDPKLVAEKLVAEKVDSAAKVETPVDAPFDGNPVTDASLADLAKSWGATYTPAKVKAAPDISLLPKDTSPPPPVIKTDLRDATADSAASIHEPPPEGSKRTIKLPDVDVTRHEDLKEGIKTLNAAVKAQDLARMAEDKAIIAEAKAKDPLAVPDVVQASVEARQQADQAKLDVEQKRKAFADYVSDKGNGLQSHLEDVAAQLKRPDIAREIVQHDFAVKEGKMLLDTATADGATFEQQAAFDTFVREKGQNIKPELEKMGEAGKNSDIARALLERAYSPREISIQVEDVGQQAALNVGLKVLTKNGGIDNADLEKYAKDYGPAMEKHMLKAADQLGYGIDTKLQIREAYHGPAFKQGVDLLKADTLDVPALQEFAKNGGKALEAEMAQTALDLGLDAGKQLELRQAYRGVESWVPVEGKDGQFVPVKPEQEANFRTMLNLLKATEEPDSPHSYINLVRDYALKNPANEGMAEPLKNYAELSGDPHLQALVREIYFPPENMTVSGKPDQIQLGDLLGGDDPVAIDKQNRFRDLSDLTQALKDAPDAELSQKRYDVFNYLSRNGDLHDAARRLGEQSADSRIVSALDSYFGTDNLNSFIEAKQKYEKVADAITPELIERMQKPGGELFWEVAPAPLETPRMWGGAENISLSKQALRIETNEAGDTVASFNPLRNPQQVKQVTDSQDGTRTIEYANGSKLVQMPQGYDVDVAADGSWRTVFSNGNYVIENAAGDIARVMYENGAETTLYRNGEVRRTGAEDQSASKFTDGTVPGADDVQATDAAKKAAPGVVANRAQIAALVDKLDSKDYPEASVAAINLKNSFGQMTDTEFVKWLNFATGTHVDAFTPAGRSMPNWPDLQLRDGGVLLQDNVQRMLRGGDTPAQQQSPEGLNRAFEGRTIIRNFLNAPEGRPSDLQYPAWLVKGNMLPPESLPTNITNDLRVRFPADKLPADVKAYLDANPEKIQKAKEGDKRGPRGPFTLPKDDIPSRMRVMSDVLQYAPKDIQEQLLKIGATDGRALRDIMQVVTPPKGPRDKAQPEEYKELLELTVPHATDIYTVKLMIQAIKDAAWSKDAAVKETNQNLAVKAALQLLPDSVKDQDRVLELVNGLASGEIRAPWVDPKDMDEDAPDVKKPTVGRHSGQIERQTGLRPGEQYPDDGSMNDAQAEEEFPEPPISGGFNNSAHDFDIADWESTTEPDPNAPLDGSLPGDELNNAEYTGEIL